MIPCNFLFFNNDIQLLEMLSIANIRFKYRETHLHQIIYCFQL